MENRPFDETSYLEANPDVALAVSEGLFGSGKEHYERHGREEGRSLDASVPATREGKLLANIRHDGRGLEIGPSHSPIASKIAGFDVDVLDHLDADELKKKYAGHGVDINSIEAVDFVWSGENLVELIGETGRYDWIIASHVIEHIPDPISFLQQCEQLLKPEGRLALIVPDKRYCFDHLQPVNLTGSFLDAFHEKRTRPSPGQVFDHFANACRRDMRLGWGALDSEALTLVHPIDQSISRWSSASTSEDYIDVHCWRFTPASFDLLVSDIRAIGLTELSIVVAYDTVGCEFYAILGREVRDCPTFNRLEKLQAITEG